MDKSNSSFHLHSSNSQTPHTLFHCLQINLGRSRNASHELLNNLNNNTPNIVFISEPYTGKNNYLKLDNINYILYQFPTDSRPTHAALAIRKGTFSTLGITSYSGPNLCIVQCNDAHSSKKVFVVSVYIEPRTDALQVLQQLEFFISLNSNSLFLIAGDFNGWHSLWGSCRNNHRGDQLYDFITKNNLIICNIGNTPTFRTVTHQLPRESIIDLTLISNSSSIYLHNWTVNPDTIPSSDHSSITFDISFYNITFTKNKKLSTFIYNTTSIDWNKISDSFAKEIANKLPSTDSIDELNPQGLDILINNVTKIIQKACDKLLPRSKGTPQKAPFWSDQLEDLKRKTIQSHHKLCRYVRRKLPLEEVISERDRARKEYAEAFCSASTANFRDFCSRQVKEDVWSVTNRIIKTKPLAQPPSTLLLNDGTHTTNSTDTAQALANHFFPDDTDDLTDTHKTIRSNMKNKPNNTPEPLFTPIEILNAIKHMSHKKAPGIDHFTADICLQFATLFTDFLTKIYNRCLQLEYFPKPWKHALIKIIPKPNKNNYNNLSSFRPIGLINVFGKLLERLIIDRLTFHLNTFNFSHPRQFGFKQQISTSTAIQTALDVIRNAKANCEHVVAVSLDIKAAFDNAWWPAIFHRLHSYNCPTNIYQILLSYITDRIVEFNFADTNIKKSMSRGCIQGSVCGPTMWNIIIDELLDIKLPDNCHIQAYADDVLLITHSRCLKNLEEITNLALSQIHEWGNNVKLHFGPEKTVITGFTNKASKINVHINNTKLNFSKEFKYLGVIIDNKFKFIKHSIYIIEKAKKLFYKLLLFTRPTWGVHSDNIKIIYEQVITPIICYAANIWSDALKYKYISKKFISLQRLFALKIIHGFRTVSTTTSISLAQLFPLTDKIKAISGIEQAKYTGNSMFLPTDIPIERPSLPASLLHPSFRTPIKFAQVHSAEELNELQPSNSWSVYTDGSQHDDVVGAAFVAFDPSGNQTTKKFKLHSSCSVFQAEMLAIEKACNWIIDKNIHSAHILSDSKSALTELTNAYSHNKFAVNIFHHLHIAHTKSINIQFTWIKAHIGILGNETADSAAKAAANLHKSPDYFHSPISYIKYQYKQILLKAATEFYENNNSSLHSKSFLPTYKQLSNFLSTVKPSFAITQLLSNHAFHKFYLHRFNITDNNTCPCNDSDIQDFNHLIHICPRFQLTRLNYYIACQLNHIDPTNLNVLSELTEHSDALNQFLLHIEYIINKVKAFNGT